MPKVRRMTPAATMRVPSNCGRLKAQKHRMMPARSGAQPQVMTHMSAAARLRTRDVVIRLNANPVATPTQFINRRL